MENLLKLHEVIAVVLLNKPDRTASEQEIADEIYAKKLYIRSDEKDYQVMQRTKLAHGHYQHLSDYQSSKKITQRIF